MHEILVISGKGGAGKTSFTGAFASLAENAVICDLDVDAPDLHLLLAPDTGTTTAFRSGNEAIIDPQICEACGLCESLCRFGAITHTETGYAVSPIHCEGCKVCVEFCPANAIAFPQKHCGDWHVSSTRFGPMIHAQLFPGEENSGRLVTLLKQYARHLAESRHMDIVLCDGAPGIGCPVISSMAGTDLAVIVTEPTPSGRHDLERVAVLCDQFRTPAAVIINKCDLNPEQAGNIEGFCAGRGYPVICRFPHDQAMTDSMVKGRVITENGNTAARRLMEMAWENVLTILPHPEQGESV